MSRKETWWNVFLFTWFIKKKLVKTVFLQTHYICHCKSDTLKTALFNSFLDAKCKDFKDQRVELVSACLLQ